MYSLFLHPWRKQVTVDDFEEGDWCSATVWEAADHCLRWRITIGKAWNPLKFQQVSIVQVSTRIPDRSLSTSGGTERTPTTSSRLRPFMCWQHPVVYVWWRGIGSLIWNEFLTLFSAMFSFIMIFQFDQLWHLSKLRSHFNGTNRGDVIYGVKMMPFDHPDTWKLTVKEKREMYGRHRIAVGSKGPEGSEVEGWVQHWHV